MTDETTSDEIELTRPESDAAEAELSVYAYPEESAKPAEGEEVAAEEPVLQAADADAEADLARPARVTQYRAQRRMQISMALPGLLLTGLGALLLWQTTLPDSERVPPAVLLGIVVGAVGVAIIARFALNGRRERGLFLIGLLILAFGALFALVVSGALFVEQLLPLSLIAVGLALGLTFTFERSHERGLLLPALALMAAGGLALPFTLGVFSLDLITIAAAFWPLILLVLALILLPLAIRSREYRD